MRHRTFWLPAAIAATAAAAVIAPAPAHADTPIIVAFPSNVRAQDGCTVTAHAPYHDGFTSAGAKKVAFKMTFTCSGGRSIEARQKGYDSDVGEGSATDLLFTRDFGPYTVPAAGGSGTWIRWVAAAHWDGVGDPVVELYHRISFRVSGGGIVGTWSPWFNSPTTNFVV